jgi:hypothetical protein
MQICLAGNVQEIHQLVHAEPDSDMGSPHHERQSFETSWGKWPHKDGSLSQMSPTGGHVASEEGNDKARICESHCHLQCQGRISAINPSNNNDDIANFKLKDLSGHSNPCFMNFALQTKVRWSKAVLGERKCPDKIIIGSYDNNFCLLVGLAINFLSWMSNGGGL